MIVLDPVTAMAGATFFALLWALSALHKITHWQDYREQVSDYRVLPQAALPLATVLLPAAEIATAIAWLFDAAHAALPSAILLAAYGAAMAWNLAHGRDSIDCGCGGDGQLIRWALVARNAVLALFSLAPLWLEHAASRALNWLDFITVAAAALVMYGVYIVVNQLLANNPPQRSRAAR